jgi:hypothetical protein
MISFVSQFAHTSSPETAGRLEWEGGNEMVREQVARYVEQDVPLIDWPWYLWRAYHTGNEVEIHAQHRPRASYTVTIKIIWPQGRKNQKSSP